MGAQKLENTLLQSKKKKSELRSCLVFISMSFTVEEVADGDLRQTPLARRQEARPGCRSGSAGKTCLCD